MDRTQLAAGLVAAMAAELAAGVAAHLEGWEGADLGTIEAEAQAVLRGAGGALTPALAKVVARDGIEAAFGQGAELVWAHLGVRVGEEVARLATEAAGAVAEADQRDRATPRGPAVPEAAVPAILVLVRERAAWREMKIARVAPLGPGLTAGAAGREPHMALGPSGYAAGLEGATGMPCARPGGRVAGTSGYSPTLAAAFSVKSEPRRM